MDVLKLITLQLITPLKLTLLLLLISVILNFLSRQYVAKLIRNVAIFWLLLWSQPYASDVLLHFVEYKADNRLARQNQKPDYIFVLACYYSTQGDVSDISRWPECSLQRNVEAARLHFKTQAPVIITGGNFLHNKAVNYSHVAKQFFLSMGIEPKHIITTSKGTNTHEEIISAKYYLNNKNVWVVSSASHIHRLQRELSDITSFTTFFPVDYHSKGDLSPYLTLPSQKALENARVGIYELMARVKFIPTN